MVRTEREARVLEAIGREWNPNETLENLAQEDLNGIIAVVMAEGRS